MVGVVRNLHLIAQLRRGRLSMEAIPHFLNHVADV